MSRALRALTAALLFALATPFATPSRAQAEGRGELFTAVEIEGWDFSSFDEKILKAVTKAAEPGADKSARREAAAALAERGNFFRDSALPQFYKYALGDFRNAARFRPGDDDSKRKAKELADIYESLGRPVPQYGNAKSGDVYLVELFQTKPKRIALEPGGSYADTGDASERAARVYGLDARAGQTLSVAVTPGEPAGKGANGVAVFDLYLEEMPGRRRALDVGSGGADYTLHAGGKYLIRVYSKAGWSAYVLKATLK